MNQKVNNEADYKWAEDWVEKFSASRAELEATQLGDEHPLLRKAQLDSMQSVINGYRSEIRTYKEKTTNPNNGESGLGIGSGNPMGLD